MRRTKVVCTIGPASASREQLERLVAAGMDVARTALPALREAFNQVAHEALQPDDLQPLLCICRMEGFEVGDLLETEGAPGRAEDDQHRVFPFSVAQTELLTFEVGKDEVRGLDFLGQLRDIKLFGICGCDV